MAEGKTNMFGKTYNTIGSTDSNFIIKTKGDLKIQWGNKFIDVIKNGKIAQSDSQIIKEVSSIEECKQNGIYIITESQEIYLCINGQKYLINDKQSSYLSFMVEQQLDSDQKKQVLTNAGFYYNTLSDVINAKLSAGIVYVQEDNKLYIIKNGTVQDYYINTITNTQNTSINDYIINGNSVQIQINGVNYISVDSTNINMLKPVIANHIQSQDYTESQGYKISSNSGVSTIEVDNLSLRSISNSTIIGKLNELEIQDLSECPQSQETPDSGIYSSNFIGLNSKLYDSIFKMRCDYPKYDSSVILPSQNVDSDIYNQVIPNIQWIKQIMDIIIPSGTIVMWSGSTIPKGWAICDGKNGTPNLIGKFIKASNKAGTTGGSNSIILDVSNLPEHTHTINQLSSNASGGHQHSIPEQTIDTSEAGEHNHTIQESIQTDVSNNSNHTHSITSLNVEVDTAEIIEGVLTPDTGARVESLFGEEPYLKIEEQDYNSTEPIEDSHTHTINIDTTTNSVESHTHSITINSQDTSIIEDHIHTIPEHNTALTKDATNTEINIEPEYYSLIFIMRL